MIKKQPNKEKADANMYYNLFADKIGKFNNDENILLIHIGNFDVISKFIVNNVNCNYFIIDKHLNGDYLKLNFSQIHFFGSNEDKSIIEILESIDMKFDKIIMNPPYTYGKGHTEFHLEILENVVKHIKDDGKIVNLSPIGWLQDSCAEIKKCSKLNKYKNSVGKYIESIDVVDVLKCREMFDNNVLNALGVYVLTKKGGFEITSLIKRDSTSLFKKIIVPCYKKEIPSIHSVGKYGIKYAEKFHCNLSVIHGNNGSKDFYDVCTPQKDKIRGVTKSDRMCIINFATDEEAEHFRLSLGLIFYKYLNFIYKRGQNLNLNLLPWMGDCINPRTGLKGYESEWTDEDFYEYFGITEEEQQLIEKTMEKYK